MRTSTLASILFVVASACTREVGADPSSVPPAAGVAAAGPAAPASNTAPATAPVLYRVPVDGLPSIGNPRALVTVVAFTDYQCPFCRKADATTQALRQAYGDDLRVVVAERPLPMHERARPAALAALAADAQGGFDLVHAKLFAGELDDAAIDAAVHSTGLDMATFDADRASTAPKMLATSEALAERLDVRGTPTFFVNGRAVFGAQPLDVFRAVVDERLAAARALVQSGVRPEDVYAQTIAHGGDKLADASEEAPSCGASCDQAGEPKDDVVTVSIGQAPARGAASAPITIVEYADYQCPFSVKAEGTLKALEAAHAGNVRVVFKNKPLPNHDKARDMARAGVAADAQGRFWPMHDRLFASGGVDRAGIEVIARDLGLDLARFDRDMSDPRTDARIDADLKEADGLDVKGTPTFFVNGRRVVGAQPVAKFEGAIAQGSAK
jgi:protein-disulfide isomerase